MSTEPMKHWVLFLNNTNLHLNHRNSFSIKEHWVEIYSHQKAINYISPSNIKASVETRPPKLPNLLQFSPPSILDILWADPPPPRASRGSTIHVFLGCVPFGESKNGFLILDLPDFAVERNVKSEIGFVTLVTFRQRVQYALQPLKK